MYRYISFTLQYESQSPFTSSPLRLWRRKLGLCQSFGLLSIQVQIGITRALSTLTSSSWLISSQISANSKIPLLPEEHHAEAENGDYPVLSYITQSLKHETEDKNLALKINSQSWEHFAKIHLQKIHQTHFLAESNHSKKIICWLFLYHYFMPLKIGPKAHLASSELCQRKPNTDCVFVQKGKKSH